MHFEIIGKIEEIETMAIGGSIRDIMRLQKQFGRGRWRKLKGVVKVRLQAVISARRGYTGMKPTALAKGR